MNTDLIINYTWWSVALVFLTGFAFAFLLYFKNKKNKLSLFWTVTLFLIRFLVVSLLAFLLLSPFYRTKIRKIEKPIIVFGLDNSTSIISDKDSVFFQTEFRKTTEQLKEVLSEKYQVDAYLFGSQVSFSKPLDFTDEISNYADFFNRINEDYKGKNVGAMIIAGDGISNRGIDPVFAASNIPFPIYAIALGDTILSRDIRINDLQFNSIAYTGDMMPLRVNISANRLSGKPAKLTIYAFEKQQINKFIEPTTDPFNQTFEFLIKAERSGKQRISIMIESDEEEANKENNKRDIFIDILDNRKKILILANSPHPDVGAVKTSLEQTGNYSIDVQFPNKIKGNLSDFDLVILHQLPSANQQVGPLMAELKENEIPLLFILGKQSNILQFNQYFKGINIRSSVGNFEDAQITVNPLFSLFSFEKELSSQLEKLPPLSVPIGNYQTSPNTDIFAYQRIKNIKMDFPMIVFNVDADQRNGLIAGEGLWLWRIQNYLQTGNFQAFDGFINKSVQYLIIRKDKRFFKVITKGEYGSNENVLIKAELYDPSYKPLNDVEIILKLTNEAGEKFNHLFSPEGTTYSLDLMRLPVGIYRYAASTKLGKENFSTEGEFIVNSRSLEGRNLNADHAMLFRLAGRHNGKMLFPKQIMQLPDMLNHENLKSKIYYEEKFTGLKDLAIVLAIILFLFAMEWFLRKYLGGY